MLPVLNCTPTDQTPLMSHIFDGNIAPMPDYVFLNYDAQYVHELDIHQFKDYMQSLLAPHIQDSAFLLAVICSPEAAIPLSIHLHHAIQLITNRHYTVLADVHVCPSTLPFQFTLLSFKEMDGDYLDRLLGR